FDRGGDGVDAARRVLPPVPWCPLSYRCDRGLDRGRIVGIGGVAGSLASAVSRGRRCGSKQPIVDSRNRSSQMPANMRDTLTKVPAVTLGFWIIKILATTLGETGGDSVSMSWLGETTPAAGQGGLNGYLVGTAVFGCLLIALIWAQIRARRLH